jgi:hypothetical protein
LSGGADPPRLGIGRLPDFLHPQSSSRKLHRGHVAAVAIGASLLATIAAGLDACGGIAPPLGRTGRTRRFREEALAGRILP